jgi:hypothetical protein
MIGEHKAPLRYLCGTTRRLLLKQPSCVDLTSAVTDTDWL